MAQASENSTMEAAFISGFIEMAEVWRMRYWQLEAKNLFPLGSFPGHAGRCAEKREDLRKQLEANLDPSAERRAATSARSALPRAFRGGGFGVVQQTTAYLGATTPKM